MCVYSARLLTENNAHCSELRLMLRWVMVMSLRARFVLRLVALGWHLKLPMVV